MKEELMKLGLDDETAEKAAGVFEKYLARKQEEFDAFNAESEKKHSAQRLESAVEIGLLKAGGKNMRILRALIDKGSISLDEGVVSGLDEQIEALKADKETGFLFESEMPRLVGVAAAEEGADIYGGSLSYEQLCKMENTGY